MPIDPRPSVAPQCDAPLDPTVPTSTYAIARCLFEGTEASQQGVAEGTLDPERVVLLRGRVLTTSGESFEGATVTVAGHPELGSVRTRVDGYYDLAANGGGTLGVDIVAEGYVSAHRDVATEWRSFKRCPDVALVPMPTEPTTLDLTEAGPHLIEGPVSNDDSGERQEFLIAASGTEARRVMPDGSVEPIDSLNARVAEATVGEFGPLAMPAELPPTSGYTYAVSHTVTLTTSMGRARQHTVDDHDGSMHREVTFADGTQRTMDSAGGVSTVTLPTHTTVTTLGGDPRFGMQAAFEASRITNLAGGPTVTRPTALPSTHRNSGTTPWAALRAEAKPSEPRATSKPMRTIAAAGSSA